MVNSTKFETLEILQGREKVKICFPFELELLDSV